MTLPNHLFASDDGALFDVRLPAWSSNPPLRPVYRRTYAKIETVAELKATLRAGQFAWPGGYHMFFVTSDGAALSFETVQAELSSVMWSIANDVDDGWRVDGCGINYEDTELRCCHSDNIIPAAYG